MGCDDPAKMRGHWVDQVPSREETIWKLAHFEPMYHLPLQATPVEGSIHHRKPTYFHNLTQSQGSVHFHLSSHCFLFFSCHGLHFPLISCLAVLILQFLIVDTHPVTCPLPQSWHFHRSYLGFCLHASHVFLLNIFTHCILGIIITLVYLQYWAMIKSWRIMYRYLIDLNWGIVRLMFKLEMNLFYANEFLREYCSRSRESQYSF